MRREGTQVCERFAHVDLFVHTRCQVWEGGCSIVCFVASDLLLAGFELIDPPTHTSRCVDSQAERARQGNCQIDKLPAARPV